MVFVLIVGVILPAIAIIFELVTRICSAFFDPIPTGWHLALLATIPVSNAVAIWCYSKRDARYIIPLAFLQGIAIGSAFVYSLIFLPMLPISIILIICLGIGLLGLSPYFALWASIMSSRRLGMLLENGARKRVLMLWAGILTSVIIIGILMCANYLTVVGLRMAASGDEDKSLQGVRLIRTFGSKTALLRACYDLPIGIGPIISRFGNGEDRITREQARTVYYKVTGSSFNSVPPPRLMGFRSGFVEDFDFDSDVGGTAVNSIVRNLSLSTSRIDTVIYPDNLVAYSEWTLVFTNTSNDQREARAQIELPPGGVVSRLTLWVNGEEREAAFASRGKVRQAYQEIAVVQQRDPVLVTTCGPDQVLMQCFPVPPSGGTMKVRVGITSPLLPENYEKAIFMLPKFVERNFKIDEGIKHSLLVESSRNISFESGIAKTKASGGVNMIHTSLSDRELTNPKNSIVCSRNAEVHGMMTPDPFDPRHYGIVQKIMEPTWKAPKRAVIVIDGSRRLADSLPDIADALKGLPVNMSFSVIQSGEKVMELTAMRNVSPAVVQEAGEKIRHMDCKGGIDNRPALIKAFELAVADEDSVILWIHGPQPLSSVNNSEQLLQLWERHPQKIKMISIAAANGRNSILAELESAGSNYVFPRRGTLNADLRRLFAQWNNDSGKPPVIVRQRVNQGVMSGSQGSKHIARLWALGEIMGICSLSDSRRLPEAVQLASRYQLVTPVSGAVVLENQEQYKQAGLNPADPATVPSAVPEPSSLLALATGAIFIGLARLRKRKQAV